MEKKEKKNLSRRQFMGYSALGMAGLTILPGWNMANGAFNVPDKDFYQVRKGIPNSQYYFRENTVGNQYLFFIGNTVLAGTGLNDPNLRYSAQMVKRASVTKTQTLA